MLSVLIKLVNKVGGTFCQLRSAVFLSCDGENTADVEFWFILERKVDHLLVVDRLVLRRSRSRAVEPLARHRLKVHLRREVESPIVSLQQEDVL